MHATCLGLAAGLSAMMVMVAAPALAQVADRTIEELKTETQARAERGAYPVNGIDPADAREALAAIKSRDPDDWAAAWGAVAERYMGHGLVAGSRQVADTNFLRAWRL